MSEIFTEYERDAEAVERRGQFALQLVLAPHLWIHRRVETVSFLSNGETRRRISWDFTQPVDAVITASAGQVAVPLTLLRKSVLMRLDVQDQEGASRSVWGAVDNGLLARDALEVGLAAVQAAPVSVEQSEAVRSIVHAPSLRAARGEIDDLFESMPSARSSAEQDRRALVRALAESLADNFMFVVELPADVVGRRSIVKMNYEGPLGGRAIPDSTGRYVTSIAGTDWSGARSWHLEVQAPEGLAVEQLRYQTWDPESLALLSSGSSDATGATAHIAGSSTGSDAVSEARLTLAPDRVGLVNQGLAAASFSWLLLLVMLLQASQLASLTSSGDRAGALAAVTLALPALVVAWLARGAEHELVSRLLILPRICSALTALVLLVAASVLVLGLKAERLELTLSVLWAAQWVVLVWALYIRMPVGGRGYGG